MTQLEMVQKSVTIAKTRGIRKQCIKCAQKGINSNMVIDEKENWYKCQRCDQVRPVDTDVSLFWNYCPNFWRDDNITKLIKIGKNIHQFFKCMITSKKFKIIPFTTWCLYPKLITADQKGNIKIKCVYCSYQYIGA